LDADTVSSDDDDVLMTAVVPPAPISLDDQTASTERGRRARHAAHELRRGRTVRGILVAVVLGGLTLALVMGGGVWFVSARYASQLDRIPNVFGPLHDDSRPAAPTSPTGDGSAPVTFLLVGSDTRGHPASGTDPDGRSDAILLVRLSADRKHAQVISIPRDSWVPIPGHGTNKINASYSWGGPSLLIQTIEELTQIRVDHYVAIDFDGIAQVTDALGGVDVTVAETTHNGPYTFTAGVNHITGEQARWYLGQRHRLTDGDFDRVRRQQQYLRAIFAKLVDWNVFDDPVRLDSVLQAFAGMVSVDATLSDHTLLSLARSARDVDPDGGVEFFTAPVLGTGREGDASVVYLDSVLCDRMWAYLSSDSLGQNASEFSRQELPDVPR